MTSAKPDFVYGRVHQRTDGSGVVDADVEAVSLGRPAVMANLKSLLETGSVLPQAPWEMHTTT
jgi:hypothetical protein